MSHSVHVFICFFFQLSKWFYMKHLRDPKIIEATTAMATQTTSDVDTWAPLHGEEAKAWGRKASKHILWLGNHVCLQDLQVLLYAHISLSVFQKCEGTTFFSYGRLLTHMAYTLLACLQFQLTGGHVRPYTCANLSFPSADPHDKPSTQ